MVLFVATAFMCLGLINLDFSRNWWSGQRRRLLFGMPLVLLFVYSAMPALVMPQALVLLLYTFIPNAAFSLWEGVRSAMLARRLVSIRRSPVRPYLVIVTALVIFAAILQVMPIVDSSGLRNLVDVTISAGKPPTASVRSLRIVPEESAVFAGDKVVGQLGAYYEVGTYNVQVERGRLVWVAPLEFRDAIKWLLRKTSPGIIVVSAQNPNVPAELRQRSSMRFIPSALLNDNLYRHVYLRYGYEQILEQTLQLNDRGDPQYLVTLGRPTIGWSGQRVTAVVIVDPATGAMQRIDASEFRTLPAWVSRVVPPDLALDYNTWFGRYVHGWWNAHLGERDVHLPARNEVFGLLAGNRFVWFVDHTSPNRTDASMTGFTYMDTVTGATTYFTAAGGEFSSQGAQRAVASNPTVRQGRLLPTQPILSNIFGENTWVVPLVADSGKYQSLALVQAANGHVTVGNVNSAAPEREAFAEYQAFIQGGAPQAPVRRSARVTGTIDRISADARNLFFTLRGQRRVYRVENALPEALLARGGDRVEFEAQRDAQGMWIARRFTDRMLQP
ncbi:MAG: hypothetical protein NVS1B14_08740 [Vulcanimicrobiaceae bacterium]